MEDERGDVREVSGSILSGNLNSETHTGGNQVEGSYEEGDGGEIMVEVVGSDVLVDGVSGDKEGDVGEGQVSDLEGHVWENRETQNFLETMDVEKKGDENMIGETELKLSVSVDEKSCDVVKVVGVNFSEPVEGGTDGVLPLKGVSVSGEAVDVPSLAVELTTVQTDVATKRTSPVISEDKRDKDELVKDSGDFVKPEFLNCPVEAVVDKEVGVVEKEEELPSTDNVAGRDYLGADFGMSHGAAAHGGKVMPAELPVNPSCEQVKDVQVDGINFVVEVGSGNTDAQEELLAASCPKDGRHGTIAEHVAKDGACGEEVKLVDQKEGFTPETKSIGNSDAIVSDVVDENQGCLHEFDGKKFESNNGIDDVSHTNSETMDKKFVTFERVEAVGVEFGGIDDVNDGASVINPSDLTSVCNEKGLKTDGDLETDIVHHNHAFSNEPTQLDTAEVNNENGLTAVNGVKTTENQLNATSSTCLGDSGIYQNQTANAAIVGEAINYQKAAVTQMEAVDGNGSSEKRDKVDSKMSKQSLECHGKAEIPALNTSEYVGFSAQDPCLNVEMGDTAVSDSDAMVNSQVSSDNVVVGFGPCRSEELQVSVQIAETSNNEAHKHESINSVPKEISNIGAVTDITQMSMLPEITEKVELPLTDITENSVCDLVTSNENVNVSMEVDDNNNRPDGLCFVEGQHSDAQLMNLEEERDTDRTYHGGMPELGTEEPVAENEIFLSEEMVNSATSVQMNISGYLLPTEDEGHFSVLDLVWGKVRSHPWWPGQIFDTADASEKAVKHYKKDAYLIAYFGDQTFAWNDSTELKPFRSHFSEIEKQNNSEAFQNAVNSALGEVSRRIELGLSCSCVPKDAYSEIESQVVENAGIREESSRQYGLDRSSQATYFEPYKLLDYIKDLARHASCGADRLDLEIAWAQLSAFCRLKGYRLPTGFPSTGELLENDADTEQTSEAMVASLKRKHTPESDSQSRKEKSLTELMGESESSPHAEDDTLSPGRKRKALESLTDGSDKRVSTVAAKYPAANQSPKPSFKIGECIRRVASQLTGATPLVKGNNDETAIEGSPRIYDHSERRSVVFSAESFSSDEILSQLQLLALDPKKGENILNNIHNFFLGYRSSIALNRRGRKKKADSAFGGSGEEFEFDDVNDSYWTDRIVHNYPEEQLLNNSESREGNLQLVPFGDEKTVKPGRKSRKRFSMSYTMGDSEIDESAKRKKQESSPAELILNFAERNCLPSEINLNKMFRRFGPLMESETEVDHDSGRAKVIFKRGSDAEVARNSSEKFNIFGPVLVNYQIGYTPLISVKISPLAIPQSQEDVTLLI